MTIVKISRNGTNLSVASSPTFVRVTNGVAASGGGTGDMLKSVYDTDDDGIVDNSEKLGNQLPAYYLATSNHTGSVDADTFNNQLPAYYLASSNHTGTHPLVSHASVHGVTGSDSVFPTDPGADRYLKWNDGTGQLEWAEVSGGTDVYVKYNASDAAAGYLADKTVAGTGITLAEGTGGDADKLKITNSAPDQTVAFTGGTNVTITGTYPNFTITDNSQASGSYQGVLTNSAGLAAALNDETGTGFAVFSDSPTFTGTLIASNITTSGSIGIGTGAPRAPLDVNGLITGGTKTDKAYYTTLNLSGSGTTRDLAEFAFPNTGSRFNMQAASIIGTNDLFFQGQPQVDTGLDTGYFIIEAWKSAGLVLMTGGTGSSGIDKDIIFRPDRDDAKRVVIKGDTGYLGVGTITPTSMTEIQGGLTTEGAVLTLGTKETTVVANDVLGRINFYAPLEASGTDAILPGASIAALAEGTFTSTANPTSLVFQTGASETATTKMTLTSAGELRVGYDTSNYLSTVVSSSGSVTIDAVGTNPTITFNDPIVLSENTYIALDPAGSADGKFTGITVTGTAGATMAFGDLLCLDPTDSRWELADANSASAADGDARGMLGMCVSTSSADGSSVNILLNGVIRADSKFPTFTVNNPIYVSETAGAVTQTQPTTSGVLIRILGAALTTDEFYFRPDWTWVTHT